MAQVYTFTDSNGEVRLMAEINPAPGAFSLLGPYTVSYTELDPVSWFDVGVLPDGSLIWAIAVFVRTAFTALNETVAVGIGVTSAIPQILDIATSVDATTPSGPPSAMAVLAADYVSHIGIAQHGAHLLASDSVGGNTAGSIDIYLLTSGI